MENTQEAPTKKFNLIDFLQDFSVDSCRELLGTIPVEDKPMIEYLLTSKNFLNSDTVFLSSSNFGSFSTSDDSKYKMESFMVVCITMAELPTQQKEVIHLVNSSIVSLFEDFYHVHEFDSIQKMNILRLECKIPDPKDYIFAFIHYTLKGFVQ